MNIFYVKRTPFLITKPNKVNYITVSHLKNRSKKIIIKAINMVKRTYLTRGFKISDYDSDNEFDNDDIRLVLLPCQLQVCAKGKHVPRIERDVRTVKEFCRSTWYAIPYPKYTILMVISLVQNMVKWLNAFPSKGGISEEMNPETIVTGASKPDFHRKRIHFGGYSMVYTGTENNMNSRTVPAISLKESNDTNGKYFMSLNTGKRIHNKNWDQLPIDEFVIDKFKRIGC